MSNKAKLIISIILLTALYITSCQGDKDTNEPSSSNTDDDTIKVAFETDFDSADTPGDKATIEVGLKTIELSYANNSSTEIIFPMGVDDSSTGTISIRYFISTTEVTNEMFAEVLQWALDNERLSETGISNLVSEKTVKYGNSELIDLDYDSSFTKISFSKSTHKFSVADGYNNYPVVCVSWNGAVMFCNWLTEMRDGNKNNCVYSGINSSWDYSKTSQDSSKTGYRLPSSMEWEYAARYLGDTAPAESNISTECVYYNKGGLFTELSADLYWTPGDYASGAIKDFTNSTENEAVAWYKTGDIQAVSGKSANTLGLHDMSGNVWEWCSTIVLDTTYGYKPVKRGGSFENSNADYLRIGLDYASYNSPDFTTGFRIVRSR